MDMLTDASRRALEFLIETYDSSSFHEPVRAAQYARVHYPAKSEYPTSRQRGGQKRAAGVVFARLHRLGYAYIAEWEYGVPLYAPTEGGRAALQQVQRVESGKLSEGSSTLSA